MQDRPPIEDVIADMNDDALAETAMDIREEGQRLLRMADLAHHELVNRMESRGATKLDTEHWAGSLSQGRLSHQINDEKLMRLRPLLSDGEWSTVRVQPPAPPPRWDKRAMNELAKRGGSIKAVIEEATTSERGRPELTLEHKP